MDYSITKDGILVCQKDFDPEQTLDCGQAFRWSKNADGSFEGYFLNSYLKISQTDKECFLFHDISENEFLDVWKDYFDFDTDYGELKRTDNDLISVIEDLGDEASGRYGSVKVIEIPDDIDWEIDDYDGIETIHEKHRVWG